jgi:hypothetical protein
MEKKALEIAWCMKEKETKNYEETLTKTVYF